MEAEKTAYRMVRLLRLRHSNKVRTYCIPFSDQFEEVVRAEFQKFTADIPMKPDDRLAASMALNELALNAVEHSRSEDNQVVITFRFLGGSLNIQVRDKGRGLVVSEPKARYYRGHGFNIVKALCDRMDVHPSGTGLTVSITKNLWRPQIGGFSI
ncbi:MAG: ATP-binding protein [Lentisphaeria bacterium]|nr:ATP-binding protein [Candidatus Neomarinimicrobiota bacterium]MCF7841312.1 ATP-binding protein [Lentisphaeria bacterium]